LLLSVTVREMSLKVHNITQNDQGLRQPLTIPDSRTGG
jgi:hypothetical protein